MGGSGCFTLCLLNAETLTSCVSTKTFSDPLSYHFVPTVTADDALHLYIAIGRVLQSPICGAGSSPHKTKSLCHMTNDGDVHW